jgi:hypothetical protein
MSPEGEASSPLEVRLLQHLDGLREHGPEPPSQLAASVISTARWQGTVRPFVQASGFLIGAMAESVRIMAGQVR